MLLQNCRSNEIRMDCFDNQNVEGMPDSHLLRSNKDRVVRRTVYTSVEIGGDESHEDKSVCLKEHPPTYKRVERVRALVQMALFVAVLVQDYYLLQAMLIIGIAPSRDEECGFVTLFGSLWNRCSVHWTVTMLNLLSCVLQLSFLYFFFWLNRENVISRFIG